MHRFAQNDETRSKLDKIRAGPTQIDPRGSNGPLKSDSRSIYAGQVLKNPGWLSGDPTDIPKVAGNGHTSSKTRDLKVGITQIDPGGSNGSKNFDILPYCDGYVVRATPSLTTT